MSAERLRHSEQLDTQQKFATAVLARYEELRETEGGVGLHEVVQQMSKDYELRADEAVQAILAHPQFEDLSDHERASLTKDTVVTKVANWVTGFFTGSAKITSEETIAVREALQTKPTEPSVYEEEEDDIQEQEDGGEEEMEDDSEEYGEEELEQDTDEEEVYEEEEEEIDEPDGVVGQAKEKMKTVTDAGKDQVGKVFDALGGQDRVYAWQNGLYSGVKYSVQNDVSKAFALGFLKDFGDGVYKRAMEEMPGMEVRHFDAVAFMEVKDFLHLIDASRESGEFTYRGKKFAVETYQPLYDYLTGIDDALPASKSSVREALMMTCVTNEEERYAARAIYMVKTIGLQTPAQWNTFRYYVGRWGSNRASFNKNLYQQVVGNNVEDILKGVNKDVLKGVEERYGYLEAQTRIERTYDRQQKPLEIKKAGLEADIKDLEERLRVKGETKTAKKDAITQARTANNANSGKWQHFKEKYLGWRENSLAKVTMTEKGMQDALNAKRGALRKIKEKISTLQTEKTAALGPLKTKLQTFDANLQGVQKTIEAASVPTDPSKIEAFLKQHQLDPKLANNASELKKQWNLITKAQAEQEALTAFFKKRPLQGSEELLARAKTMQVEFGRTWSSEIKTEGGRQVLKAKELDPKVHEEFKKIQLQYNAAYKKFKEERAVVHRKIDAENRKLKSLQVHVKSDPRLAPEVEATRRRILGYGKELGERQKELSTFAKDFFRENNAVLKTMEGARKGTLQKSFKGVLWKYGTPLILGLSVVKQGVDVFKGENTVMQAAKDIGATAAGLVPIYGTYQDFQAWRTGKDEAGRTLSYGERMFRGAMVPLGAVADATFVFGIGAWMRGGITAAKLGVRGIPATVRGVRTWQKARGIQETGRAAKELAVAGGGMVKRGAEATVRGIKTAHETVPKMAINAIQKAPGKLAMHKGKVALATLGFGGLHMVASLEPVGAGEWQDGTELTADDWGVVEEFYKEEGVDEWAEEPDTSSNEWT